MGLLGFQPFAPTRSYELTYFFVVQFVGVVAGDVAAKLERRVPIALVEAGLRRDVVSVFGFGLEHQSSADVAEGKVTYLAEVSLAGYVDHGEFATPNAGAHPRRRRALRPP